jgi:hypothetical protein
MRILVILPDNPPKRILVELKEQQHIMDLKDLINRKEHSRAIEITLQKGSIEREIKAGEFENLDTDLVLKKDSAHWDIAGDL